MSNKVSPTTIEGNNVIDCHLDCDFPVFLVEVTNQDCDECGKFAVVTDCGWNPLEGWREFDYRYFGTLETARSAFDQEVGRIASKHGDSAPRHSKFANLSLDEVEVLMELAAGRVEDLECDDRVIPSVLEKLAEELTEEHIARTNS